MYVINSVHSVLTLTSSILCHGWRQHCIFIKTSAALLLTSVRSQRCSWESNLIQSTLAKQHLLFSAALSTICEVSNFIKKLRYLCKKKKKKSLGSGVKDITEVHYTACFSKNRNHSVHFTEECLFNYWRLPQWQVHPYLIIMKHKFDVFAWVRLPSGK